MAKSKVKISKNCKEQDVLITAINKDVEYLKEDICEIKAQVFNHLPTKLDELEKRIIDSIVSTKTWLIALLVSIILLLIGVVINFFKG